METSKMRIVLTVVVVGLLLSHLCPSCRSEENRVFHIYACSNPQYHVILKTPSAVEKTTNTALECASTCGEDTECTFAIHRQTTRTCQHIHAYDEGLLPKGILSAPPDYIDEDNCVVFIKENKPVVCQNGGNLLGNGVMCSCPQEFHGRLCEEPKPDFCNTNSWREASMTNYTTLLTSFLEVKLFRRVGSSIKISNINSLKHLNGFYRLQSHNFLSVNSCSPSLQDFEYPLKREFNYYTDKTDQFITKKVSMLGQVTTQKDPSGVAFQLLIRDAADDSRLVYDSGSTGNIDDLIDALYLGHRVIVRDPARTEFNKSTESVVFQEPKRHLGEKSTTLKSPLYYYASKSCVGQNRRYIKRQFVASGSSKSFSSNKWDGRVELDRCWTKIPLNLPYKDTLDILKEVVLSRGQEIRLIMAAYIATDVTIVTITDSDVVASLADYLTTTDALTPFSPSSHIRFSSVSLSQTLSECDMTFQGSTVHRFANTRYPSTLQWVVSARSWVPIFVQTSSGMTVSGTEQAVYAAASSGGNVRVCVERMTTKSVTTTCFTGVELTLEDGGRHVTVQSPAALDISFSATVVVGPDCRRTVSLVSTKGWVKAATFVIGVEDTPEDVTDVEFLTVTWFEQR